MTPEDLEKNHHNIIRNSVCKSQEEKAILLATWKGLTRWGVCRIRQGADMREAMEKKQEGAVGIVGRPRAHGRKQVTTTQAFAIR